VQIQATCYKIFSDSNCCVLDIIKIVKAQFKRNVFIRPLATMWLVVYLGWIINWPLRLSTVALPTSRLLKQLLYVQH